MYRRILSVDRSMPESEGSRHHVVALNTKELQGPHDVFPKLNFYFKMVPPGKEDPDWGDEPTLPPPERRLGFLSSIPFNLTTSSNIAPSQEESTSQAMPSQAATGHTLEDMAVPEEQSQFHWNWDYLVNSTRTPQMRYRFQGGELWFRLYRPYFKANCTMTMNFSSHIHGFTHAPHVIARGYMDGFFDINADIATLMNFENDKSFGVINNFWQHVQNIPGLPNFTNPTDSLPTIRPVNFYLGGVTVTFRPGFNTKLKAYHRGLLQGTLTVTLRSHLRLQGIMEFDTQGGLQTNITATALNVTLVPPQEMLFTQSFELGMMLDNEMYLAGGLSDNPMRASISLRPFTNISIKQEGADMNGFLPLAVYPFRLVGAPQGHCYSVMLSANGYNATTSCQLSTGTGSSGGVVEWSDDPQGFQLGMVALSDLISTGIFVTILQDGDTPIGSGTAACTGVVNGECQPAPITVGINNMLMQVGIMHDEDATGLLESKIKSVSLRFPGVKITPSSLPPSIRETLASPQAAQGMVLQLQLRRNGKVLDVPLTVNRSSGMIRGTTIYDLGPLYLDAWQFPSLYGNSPIDESAPPGHQRQLEKMMRPTLNLTAVTSNSQAVLLGVGELPPVMWDQATAASFSSLAQQVLESLRVIPLSVPLYDPQYGLSRSTRRMIGTARLQIFVQPPSRSAFWVFPNQALGVSSQTGEHTFYWTVQTSNEARQYIFQGEPTIIGTDGNLQQMNPPHSFTTTPLTCSSNTGLPVHHYTGSVPPCIFQYPITLPQQPAGTYMVMLIKYLDGGNRSHYALSAPFRVQQSVNNDAVSLRRLDDPRRLQLTSMGFNNRPNGRGGYAQGRGKVGQTIRNIRRRCSPEPLRYRISGGVNLVESVDNMMLPASMGQMGASQAPTSTRTQNLFRLGNGSDHGLQHLMPRSVCSGGVCSAMRPGCNRTKVTPLTIKAIKYTLARDWKYKEHLTPKMRTAVAYGLALVPSAVSVTASGTPTRRLKAGTVEVVDPDEQGLEYNTFTARFLSPPYELTQELLEELNEREAFRFIFDGREDELGPIKIKSMELWDEGPPQEDDLTKALQRKFEAQPLPHATPDTPAVEARVHRSPLHLSVWGSAGAAGMFVFAAAALRFRRSFLGERCNYRSVAQPTEWEESQGSSFD
jgi:hypothetical protein